MGMSYLFLRRPDLDLCPAVLMVSVAARGLRVLSPRQAASSQSIEHSIVGVVLDL
jgi:hypothetical protein